MFNTQRWFRTLSRLQLKGNQLRNIFFLVCFKYTEMLFIKPFRTVFGDKIKACLIFMLFIRMRNIDT